MKDQIAPLRQQLKQLKSLHDRGGLDATAYASAKAALERKLLDHVLETDIGAARTTAANSAPVPRPSLNLVGQLAVVVLVLAGAGYLWTGSPGLPSAGAPGTATESGAAAPHSLDDAAFAEAVNKLAVRLKDEPDNVEGWSMLARSYARMGRHAEAAPAFEKATRLQPGDASLLADYADTLAMQNGRVLEGAPLQLVARALKIDPDNAKALALAGTAAFNRQDYAAAVRQWERLAQVSPPEAGFLPQLQGSIDEARRLAGMPAGAPPARAGGLSAAPQATATPVDAAPPAADTTAAAAAPALVTGSVRLSAAVAKLAAPTDAVFIYARPAEGSRMPLAIQRHQVKDLPLEFKLDDGMAMSPAAKMSLFPKVIISARVSKSGQAMAAPGDLTGQSPPVANTSSGLVVEINEVVKN